MLFSLEVVQAKHGDCLLLHFGDKNKPGLMLIDGGPSGVYEDFLRPRLMEIKEKNARDGTLRFSMVMVSHMDDDHANGICMLTDELTEAGNDAPFSIDHLWVNTFDDVIGNDQVPVLSALAPSSAAASITALGLPDSGRLDHENVAVIASTSQGRQLRDNAKKLGIPINVPFKPIPKSKVILVRGDTTQSVVPLQGLKITVVSPDHGRLEKLQAQWDKDLKKLAETGDRRILTAALASPDTSPFNLSSIACVVEYKQKKILLTGDARSDDVLKGLKANKLLDRHGKLHVDILKIPHHGSIRNMTKEFLERVTADHYVISANGMFNNPDKSFLDLLAETVDAGTVHLTNHTGKLTIRKDVDGFIRELKDTGSGLTVEFPASGENSMVINLLDEVNF